MNGTDHLMPQPWLGRVVAEANDLQDDYDLEVTSLAEHLAHGERPTTCRRGAASCARARAPTSSWAWRRTASTCVRPRRARSGRSSEAEPLAALFQPADRWPAALLDEAWLHVIRNAAHDSICACSVDEVCDAVLYRYAEAAQIGEGLRATRPRRARHVGRRRGPVIVNPTARTRAGSSRSSCPGTGERPGAQILNERPAERVLIGARPRRPWLPSSCAS